MATPKRRKQRQARRQLPRLLREQNNKCHYCKERIALVCDVKNLVKTNHHYFYYIDNNGVEKKVKRATTEHLVSMGTGGTNRLDNLVAACMGCNSRQNNIHQKGKKE